MRHLDVKRGLERDVLIRFSVIQPGRMTTSHIGTLGLIPALSTDKRMSTSCFSKTYFHYFRINASDAFDLA